MFRPLPTTETFCSPPLPQSNVICSIHYMLCVCVTRAKLFIWGSKLFKSFRIIIVLVPGITIIIIIIFPAFIAQLELFFVIYIYSCSKKCKLLRDHKYASHVRDDDKCYATNFNILWWAYIFHDTLTPWRIIRSRDIDIGFSIRGNLSFLLYPTAKNVVDDDIRAYLRIRHMYMRRVGRIKLHLS